MNVSACHTLSSPPLLPDQMARDTHEVPFQACASRNSPLSRVLSTKRRNVRVAAVYPLRLTAFEVIVQLVEQASEWAAGLPDPVGG